VRFANKIVADLPQAVLSVVGAGEVVVEAEVTRIVERVVRTVVRVRLCVFVVAIATVVVARAHLPAEATGIA